MAVRYVYHAAAASGWSTPKTLHRLKDGSDVGLGRLSRPGSRCPVAVIDGLSCRKAGAGRSLQGSLHAMTAAAIKTGWPIVSHGIDPTTGQAAPIWPGTAGAGPAPRPCPIEVARAVLRHATGARSAARARSGKLTA